MNITITFLSPVEVRGPILNNVVSPSQDTCSISRTTGSSSPFHFRTFLSKRNRLTEIVIPCSCTRTSVQVRVNGVSPRLRPFIDDILSRVGIWRQVQYRPMEQRKHRQLHIPQDMVSEVPGKHGECESSAGRHDVLRDVYRKHNSISHISELSF